VQPKHLLRVEGLALFALATGAYFAVHGGGWILYLVLLLAPDLSMSGYLANERAGSATYNAVHTALVPAALLAGAWYLGWSLGTGLALIWLAHLGMDRTVGFGLKYPDAPFSETHLQRV
jgi:lysylphosphatidylglycerol synthetase-like protein (DUF2156 family)